jgi:hypothetical protein
MFKKLIVGLIVGTLNLGLVPVTFADDANVTNTGPCAEMEGRGKFRCIRQNQRQVINDACGDVEDRKDRLECMREQREDRMQQLKEDHPKWSDKQRPNAEDRLANRSPKGEGWNAGVRRRIGHSLREQCSEMKGKEKRDCIHNTKKGLLSEHPRRMLGVRKMFGPEAREALKGCRELTDSEDRRQCVNDLRKEFRDDE